MPVMQEHLPANGVTWLDRFCVDDFPGQQCAYAGMTSHEEVFSLRLHHNQLRGRYGGGDPMAAETQQRWLVAD